MGKIIKKLCLKTDNVIHWQLIQNQLIVVIRIRDQTVGRGPYQKIKPLQRYLAYKRPDFRMLQFHDLEKKYASFLPVRAFYSPHIP